MAFKTYNLTKEQLIKLTKLCNQEQGSVKGCRAEASLMANLFEKQSKYKTIYEYVRNSGWFSRASYHMDNGTYTSAQYSAVYDVIVNGNRLFPNYIDEHDCLSDIEWIKVNGKIVDKYDKSNYIKDVTKVRNVYPESDIWTFYCFPDTGCDPFGYTSKPSDEPQEKYEPKSIRESICARTDVGDDVKVLQSVLNYHFGYDLEVDGEFGGKTENALISAQKQLFPDDPSKWDGICGESTWEKLLD